jgi:tetratricopeptide (TPR) repeat protein
VSRSPALFVAARQNQLWPSIHAATDVYLRRKGCGADSYELIWRLVHIWECCAITLAAAAAARIRSLSEASEADRSIREKCYGVSRNDILGKLERQGFGAFDGSVDRWIEILFLVASLPTGQSPFLDSLIALLNASRPAEADTAASGLDVGPLIAAWRMACDVPASLDVEIVDVKMAMRVINSFRNRFAHVPFPYDRLDEINRHLEACTFQLFELQPLASNSALLGGIRFGRHFVVGASHHPDAFEASATAPEYVFGYNKKGDGEGWSAAPFVHIDRMMRPYVLTRLRDEEGAWEYTRYLAESNTVLLVTDPDLVSTYPRPADAEYPMPPEAAVVKPIPSPPIAATPAWPAAATPEDAVDALHRRDFDRAIPLLEQLVTDRPHYHTGWLRLGVARREKAVALVDAGQRAEAEPLLKAAIEALEKASQHAQPWGRADALYNLSKALYRLWIITSDMAHAEDSRGKAAAAYKLSPDDRYATWVEFLSERLRGVVGGT